MLQFILTLIMWLLVGGVTANLARRRGRDPTAWFVSGILFGLFSLILLWLLPPQTAAKPATAAASPVTGSLSKTPEKNQMPTPLSAKSYTLAPYWYVAIGQEQQGPLHFDQLQELWHCHNITSDTLVWMDGMPEWQKIAQLPFLLDRLS